MTPLLRKEFIFVICCLRSDRTFIIVDYHTFRQRSIRHEEIVKILKKILQIPQLFSVCKRRVSFTGVYTLSINANKGGNGE